MGGIYNSVKRRPQGQDTNRASNGSEGLPLTADGIATPSVPTEDENNFFVAMAKHPFVAEADKELNLSVGDYVVVRKVNPNGWSEGECRGKAGWFPSAYVKKQEKAAVSKFLWPQGHSINQASNGSEGRPQTAVGIATPSLPAELTWIYVNYIAMAEHPYFAEADSELNLSVNDCVLVCKVSSNGWSEGECKGKAGWFPSAYVGRQENAAVSKLIRKRAKSGLKRVGNPLDMFEKDNSTPVDLKDETLTSVGYMVGDCGHCGEREYTSLQAV